MNENTTTAKIIYVLYLVSILVGLTGLIGVIIAYVSKSDAEQWLQEHYRFQIRTFWIGFLYLFIAAITMAVGIGYLILIFWLIWIIVRCIKGLKALEARQQPANVESWLFA